MFAVLTTGRALVGTAMVKGDQTALSAALQANPSKARIWRLSLILLVTKDVWATWAAVISTTVPAALVSPATTQLPLSASRLESQSWYFVMVSPSLSCTFSEESRLDRLVVVFLPALMS